MKMNIKRGLGVFLPLLIICVLFLYSGLKLPEKRPRTVRILDSPQEFEGERVRVSGKLKDWENENGTLYLSLERFGRTYEVKTGEISKFGKGDTINVEGRSFLKDRNYIDAEKVKVWHKEDRKRVYLLSFAGLGFILVVLARDRKKLTKVVPWPTG